MEREGDAMTLVTPLDTAVVFEIEKALGVPIERRKVEDFDYSAPAPVRDDTRRAPTPRSRQSNTAQSPQKARPAPKAKATRSPSYFAQQRTARAKSSGGY